MAISRGVEWEHPLCGSLPRSPLRAPGWLFTHQVLSIPGGLTCERCRTRTPVRASVLLFPTCTLGPVKSWSKGDGASLEAHVQQEGAPSPPSHLEGGLRRFFMPPPLASPSSPHPLSSLSAQPSPLGPAITNLVSPQQVRPGTWWPPERFRITLPVGKTRKRRL